MALHETPFYFRVDFGCDVLNGNGHLARTITKEGDTVDVVLRGGVNAKLRCDAPILVLRS